MQLIAKKLGWEENAETGEQEFVIRLVATRKEDVPDITFDDLWKEVPLRIERLKR